ncbi:MAG: hypothetical protein P4M13_08380 [Alphaproteobacteria bacterium]|nr:hypothetical protein [Alphaproteobacteria bacterium]
MRIYEIPEKLTVDWNEDVKAVFDTWTNYTVTVDQFREAVINKGLAHAKTHGGHAYVVDSSKAHGAFSQAIMDFIGTDAFPAFAKGGIKYFITIKSAASATTNLSIKGYAAKAGPFGLQLLDLPDQNAAIAWLKEHP